MKNQLFVTVAVASSIVLFASVPAAAEGQAPGVCATVPDVLSIGSSPVPLASCGFCSGEDFCPKVGIRCSWQGTCDKGPNHCCNYTCTCDGTCTSVSQLAEACPFQVPRVLCQVSYCGSEGIRCVFSTLGPGCCCGYECGPDPTCILPDPLPPNAC
jgi:hypothetical protein